MSLFTQIFVCGEPLGYNQESLVLWRSIILGTMDPSVVTPVDIVQVPDSCAGNIQAKADGLEKRETQRRLPEAQETATPEVPSNPR